MISILLRSAFILLSALTISVEAAEENVEQSKMLGLRTVAYEVENLATAIEWYTKAFGVKPYVESPEYVGFNIQGYELGLMPESDSPVKGNNVLAYWGVENIDTEVDRLISLGAEIQTPIMEVGGGIRLCTLKDPFGNILGIIYNPIFTLE